jgi:hypothetical protein
MKLVIYEKRKRVIPATFLKAEKERKRVHKDESYEDFISRKMSAMKDEFPDQKQRYAVANSMWEKEKGKRMQKGLTPKKRDYSKYDQKQLKIGIGIEKEHTSDEETARHIAADHLDEIPDYYTRLVRMEKEADKERSKS